MTLTLEYGSEAPGITAERMKRDFEAIWKQNIVLTTLTRASDSQAGDYFHEGDDPGKVTMQVWMNIQGKTSGYYGREKPGISTTGAEYHAYVRHDQDIQNLDVITWNKKKFIVKELNEGIHNGIIIFKEFDLVKVDKSG